MTGVGEPAKVLRLETRPVPEPGPGQVRVRVQAAPVNPNDLHMLRGRYGFAPELSAVLGQESVGAVDALGAGVDELAADQRVVTIGVLGTWQEYLVADVGRILAVPEPMTTSTAARLVTNPLTGLVLVTSELDVQPGEWLLQTAAGSTVGRIVLQLGRRFEFKTINVFRRRSAVEEIVRLGGTEVICTEDEDLQQRVRQLLIYQTSIVRGFWLYRWFAITPAARIEATLGKAVELVAGGAVRIPRGHPVKLDEFAEAMSLAEAPAHVGRPLLIFGDAATEGGHMASSR